MVDDQSTLSPRRPQAFMCTILNQPHAIVLSKPHKPSGLRHVFPRPRSRSPSASRSYVVVAEITAIFCFDQHPRQSIRQSSPTQPKLSDCNHASPRVVSARTSPCIALTPCVCIIPVTTHSRLLQALYSRRCSQFPYDCLR